MSRVFTHTYTHTHTYVLLQVGAITYKEIRDKLIAAGYEDAIDEKDGTIDMHGLALQLPPINELVKDHVEALEQSFMSITEPEKEPYDDEADAANQEGYAKFS